MFSRQHGSTGDGAEAARQPANARGAGGSGSPPRRPCPHPPRAQMSDVQPACGEWARGARGAAEWHVPREWPSAHAAGAAGHPQNAMAVPRLPARGRGPGRPNKGRF